MNEEHAHTQRRWPDAVNAVGLLCLGIVLVLLGGYLKHRQDVADGRNRVTVRTAQNNRYAICTALESVEPAQRSDGVKRAILIDRCGQLRLSSLMPHFQVTPAAPGSPPQGGPLVFVTVPPDASVRRRASTPPAPHRAPSPRTALSKRPNPPPSRSPSPSPRPSICLPGICLHR